MATVTVDRDKPVPEGASASKLMKAIVRREFGSPDVLRLEDVEKPVPNDVRGVLVKVHASSVNPADYYEMSAPLFIRPMMKEGLRRPKNPRLGSDVAGVVMAVTEKITQFKPGDEVFGVAPDSYAEYTIAREDRLVLKPANCSFEEAGAVGIAAFTALQGLRDHGNIQAGEKVLVNGAGGGVGTFAVQLAKSFGAEVTAVTSPENLEMVRSLGADHVIDYTKEDFTRTGQKYDLIADIAAAHSISSYKRALNPNGRLVIIGMRKDKMFARLLFYQVPGRVWPKGGRKLKFFIAKSNQKDLIFLKALIETGKLRPVVGRKYPLAETADAMRHLREGHSRGKVGIIVDQEPA